MKSEQERAAELRRLQVQAKEAKEQQRALAQLALNLLNDKCPVCEQDYDVERTRNRLESIIATGDQPAKTLKEEESFEALVRKEKEASTLEIKARNTFAEAETIQKRYLQWDQIKKSKLSDLGIENPEEPKVRLTELIESCDTVERDLSKHADEGEKLSFNLARELASCG